MCNLSPLTVQDVANELKKPLPTLITCHVKPDGDSIGSAFALKALLSVMGSRAWVICAEECPDRLRFLLDEEQNSILPSSIPSNFTEMRIIAMDIASPMQAGALFEAYGDRYTMMIDHHGRGTPFADHWIEADASATGEMIYKLACVFLESGVIDEIPTAAASAMYAAISSDTGCFRYSNATPDSHRAAAELIALGIDSAEINRRLYMSVSFLQLSAEHEGFRRLQLFQNGRIAAITFPYEVKTALGLRDEHTETLIDVARVIEGVEVAFVLKQSTEAPMFRLSMRSAVDFDVSEICAIFGGGGHKRAAGATIEAPSMEEALKLVLDAIRVQI